MVAIALQFSFRKVMRRKWCRYQESDVVIQKDNLISLDTKGVADKRCSPPAELGESEKERGSAAKEAPARSSSEDSVLSKAALKSVQRLNL